VSLVDRFYFIARFSLAALTVAVAVATLMLGWRADFGGRRWYTGLTLGVLLCLAAALSVYDAVDNVLVRILAPITDASWLWLFGFDLLLPLWALLLIRAWRARDRAEMRLADLAYVDPVTGALNRRGFIDRAAPALALARRAGMPTSVVMLDLDHFKDINDRLGHAAGDQALRLLATVLQGELRATDVLGRVGGDEFVVLLPACDVGAGQVSATRWRIRLKGELPNAGFPLDSLLLSAGVAEIGDAADPVDAITQACAAADAALYEAKRLGRDRVEIAAPLTGQGGPTITKS
jgi:diguanylate cyclase (GGDEF)-like protein